MHAHLEKAVSTDEEEDAGTGEISDAATGSSAAAAMALIVPSSLRKEKKPKRLKRKKKPKRLKRKKKPKCRNRVPNARREDCAVCPNHGTNLIDSC